MKEWSRQQCKVYNRVRQGLAVHRDDRIRFMTLTSPNQGEDMAYHWQKLYQRIRRAFGRDFEYLAVYTTEGNGVIHVIYAGRFIPYGWLKKNWLDLHGAWSVNIQDLGTVESRYAVSRYMVQRYMTGQDKMTRFSYSRGWLGMSAARIDEVKKQIREFLGLKPWLRDREVSQILDRWLTSPYYTQTLISDYAT